MVTFWVTIEVSLDTGLFDPVELSSIDSLEVLIFFELM